MKKCINFIAYNRPDYFSKVLNSWKNVDKINEYDIYIFIDYSDKIQEIKNLIRKFIKEKVNASKQKVEIIISNPKKGVNNSMYNALSYSFDKLKYDFVVMAEDDIVVTKDSLKLLECMLEISKKEKNIVTFSLFGGNKFENTIESMHNATKLYKIHWFNPWGWAITNKNWTLYIKKFWSFDYTMGWDVHITENIMKKQKLFMIGPIISRSKNIGIKGTNSNVNNYNKQDLYATKLNTNFQYNCNDLLISN